MNIFYLDNDPKTCAIEHVDKHVVKMILEYGQLLSTAHRVCDGYPDIGISASGRKRKVWLLADDRNERLCAATHINHPSASWVRESDKNYMWLYDLFLYLQSEYTHRYGKIHSFERLISPLSKLPRNIPMGVPFSEPPPAMPDKYKVIGDSIQSYHNYYMGEKRHFANWKSREIPLWYK